VDLSFMGIQGPTMEISPEVINYRKLKLTFFKNEARILDFEW
jgi:hypothetical protein